MFSRKEIKKLQELIIELSEKIDKISEKQNSQFTDIVLQLKETKDEISNAKENARLLVEGDEEGVNDSLYEDVKELVLESRKASTSFIQRIFGIGYSRAAKLIDTLEEQGVIGSANGSKPREVFIEKDE